MATSQEAWSGPVLLKPVFNRTIIGLDQSGPPGILSYHRHDHAIEMAMYYHAINMATYCHIPFMP